MPRGAQRLAQDPEQIARELRGEDAPLDRAEITRRALTSDPAWVGLTEACRIMSTTYTTLVALDYRLTMATKSAGIAGRGGGVLLRRADVETVVAIRRLARLSLCDAFRVFAARAKILPLLSGGERG